MVNLIKLLILLNVDTNIFFVITLKSFLKNNLITLNFLFLIYKKKSFSEWVKRNLESPVSQLVECAKTFQHWAYEIKNSLEVPYSNGPIEGTNNKIKALKRTTFGMPNFKARIMLLD